MEKSGFETLFERDNGAEQSASCENCDCDKAPDDGCDCDHDR